jgi:hypothetical protein
MTIALIDTLGIPEYFVEALARVERIGPNRRLVFTVTQPDGSGGLESVAVVKLVASLEVAVSLAATLLNDSHDPVAFASISMSAAN